MIIFPQNPIWFALKFTNILRKHEKCAYKPSIRQALSICSLILARFLRKGICDIEDFIEIAVVTSPLENQALAKKIARDLLIYSEPTNREILDKNLLNSDLLGDLKPSSLVNEFEDELNDIDNIFDDLDFLNKHFDEINGLDLDSLYDSMFNDFFNKFGNQLHEEPYKTALNVIEDNAITNFERFQDLDSMLDFAKELLDKKINNLEPEDINSAKTLEMLDDIIKKTGKFREQVLSQLAKDNILNKFKKSIEESFQNNFFDALSASEFALKSNLLDEKGQKVIEDLFSKFLNQANRNVNDLYNAYKILGKNLDLNDDDLDNIIENSLDLPFDEAYQNMKNIDQYFGGNMCEQYLNKLSEKLDKIESTEDIENSLISMPTKIPSWRKLLSKIVDNDIQKIKDDYKDLETICAQLKNLSDNLMMKQSQCSDAQCRSQISSKILDSVNQTVANAGNKEQLINVVKSFNDKGFFPDIDTIKKTGKKLKMTDDEISSLIEANFKNLKKMVEVNKATYQIYKDFLKKLNLNYNQINQLVNAAVNQEKPNMPALSALSEKHLSEVLNSAERLGSKALDLTLSSLSAGSGLDLLEQWFYSRHNMSSKVKTKLKEIIKQIMIDLGIRSANSLIGSANYGPIVENIVIPYTVGDDFELIDLEETINNLMEGGKTVDMISNEDFLVSKTSQGLRCLVLELDISGSMSGEKLAQMALCTTMLVYAFNPEEIALTFFESNTHKLKNLDEKVELETVVDELLDITARGGTCINSALKWANHQFEKKARSKYKLNILFTDADVFDFDDSLRELKKMSEKDVKFVMVVPQFNFSPVMAKKMVKSANGVLLTLNQWRDFPKLISEIITNQNF